MIPKVGQLLRWFDNTVLNPDGHANDVGLVTEVRSDGYGEYAYAVIIDWCKGPHESYHDCEEYEESIGSGEIVVVV